MHIVHTIVLFAIVLGIMVLIHELGHFVMAKLCRVKVEVFSIGFGPRIVGFRYGDTDYRISALPLGGYVKMFGDTPGERPRDRETLDVLGIDIDSPGEFNGRPRWQRVLIALAGPFANFILSFFLLVFVAHYHHEVDKYLTGTAVVDYVPLNTPAARDGLAPGDTITRFGGDTNPTWDQISKDAALNVSHSLPISFLHNGQTVSRDIAIISGDNTDQPGPDMLSATGLIPRESDESLIVKDVTAGGPGDRAGLKPNDSIVSINGLQIHSLDTLIAYLQDGNGSPATVAISRNSQPITLQLTPEKGDNGLGVIKWLIGFHAKHVPIEVQHLPLGQSIVQSARDNWDSSTLVMRILKGIFTRHVSVKSMSGPVGIAQQIEIASEQGIWPLVDFTALISIQLGIFNLLPIPILDGGMILFLLIESILRRDVNEVLKERIYQVAFVCIILLAVFVFFNDITRMHGH
jgi:regulator of sigma E protease